MCQVPAVPDGWAVAGLGRLPRKPIVPDQKKSGRVLATLEPIVHNRTVVTPSPPHFQVLAARLAHCSVFWQLPDMRVPTSRVARNRRCFALLFPILFGGLACAVLGVLLPGTDIPRIQLRAVLRFHYFYRNRIIDRCYIIRSPAISNILGTADHRIFSSGRMVRTSQPVSVIRTVCSNCALGLLRTMTVNWSSHCSIWRIGNSVRMGSIVNTLPGSITRINRGSSESKHLYSWDGRKAEGVIAGQSHGH